jgi:hypothetical protein
MLDSAAVGNARYPQFDTIESYRNPKNGPMNLNDFPVGITHWSQIPESIHSGASGIATIRSRQLGNLQLRIVVYSANYVADHWCYKGHIVFVIEGQLMIEHQNNSMYALMPGTCYHVADDDGPPHRVLSENGATIFVVD